MTSASREQERRRLCRQWACGVQSDATFVPTCRWRSHSSATPFSVSASQDEVRLANVPGRVGQHRRFDGAPPVRILGAREPRPVDPESCVTTQARFDSSGVSIVDQLRTEAEHRAADVAAVAVPAAKNSSSTNIGSIAGRKRSEKRPFRRVAVLQDRLAHPIEDDGEDGEKTWYARSAARSRSIFSEAVRDTCLGRISPLKCNSAFDLTR
jgi:hypothetical protein